MRVKYQVRFSSRGRGLWLLWKKNLMDPQMTLSITRSKVCHIYCTTTHESQILACFTLWLLIFQIIDVFCFSIGYNSRFEYSTKNHLKNHWLKFSKIPNIVWWPLKTWFMRSLINFSCDLQKKWCFLLEILCSEKLQVHRMTPKWPWMLQGQRYPIYVALLPSSPKFHSVLIYNHLFSRLRFFISE